MQACGVENNFQKVLSEPS